MVAMYGDFLQSEQVSVAHHGVSTTASKAFYNLIKPAVIWYPGPANSSTLDSVTIKGRSAYASLGTHGGCRMIIFNGTPGENVLKPSPTLIMSATGPLYDQVYNALDGMPYEAKGELWQVVDVKKYIGLE
jgi:hypothetical protein